MRKNVSWIAGSSLIACTFMYIVEQGLDINYAIKTLIKIILFLSIPVLYAVRIKNKSIRWLSKRKQQPTDGLALSIGLGILSFACILLTYAVLQRFIDLERISADLQTDLGITPRTFIFVALYVTFGNSLLEEYFFRGFVFLEMYKEGYRTSAYVFSSVLFGLYHIAIFQSWFPLPLMILALAGLIGVAFVFNWLDAKSGTFVNSWVVHIFADTAIVLIGFRIFGIL
ncbi:CPBP family intramembrane glutamic endopeptidase [Planococcus lenghuensis]|uniref:CPBP family intramembrane glutamic endopeptidase n=1 Tax=Planococcus lenghuensis TaxID=2213202 RepID=UPI0009868290|nr:CPBP family intramembrane glutamic endopeptidase [Planococcus lenghuensis]